MRRTVSICPDEMSPRWRLYWTDTMEPADPRAFDTFEDASALASELMVEEEEGTLLTASTRIWPRA
jgi:hypothetical protein